MANAGRSLSLRFLLLFPVFAFCVLYSIGVANAAEKLVVATSKSGWLIWIAQERGLFEDYGADVAVELVESGVEAGKGLIDGRYDIATMSEFAFVSRSFSNVDLRIFGTAAAIYNVRLVGRLGSGLASFSDLPGKKIGLRTGAIGEFFLGKTLDLHGTSLEAVQIEDIPATDLPNAVADGKVDAIVSWEPYATEAQGLLGDDAMFADLQSEQPYYFTLSASQKTLIENQETIERFLQALIDAAEWAQRNETEAMKLLGRVLNLNLDDLERFWSGHVMEVAITQDLLFLMEQEARWRVERGLSAGGIPNYLERLETGPLERVAPHHVGVIQ
ncbi:ABC transporter substrate-binding protein [Hwanghaeella grinnelliae]|uniref:ABC transporter substrate-binding protein n=1 Tax=Hwanghaeella grinnelliae TaxID=2500179 RepID=UPI0023D94EDA|nr:ABC transporter substrate-binding protein [Hwanghaeella grinnelliae]